MNRTVWRTAVATAAVLTIIAACIFFVLASLADTTVVVP